MGDDIVARLVADRDRWRKVAEQLATELGKVEYAYTEYQNQVDNQ